MERTGTGHCLGAIRCAEFCQEMLDVEFDGVQAEYQVLGNLLVGETFGHQLEHIVLTVTQRIKGVDVWCWLCRDIGLSLPRGGNRCLDALKVVRRGGGKRGHQREQVRHHLALVGKEA